MCLFSSLTGRGQTASSVGVSKRLSPHRAATTTATGRSPAGRLPHHLPRCRRSHQPPWPASYAFAFLDHRRAPARGKRRTRAPFLARALRPAPGHAHWARRPFHATPRRTLLLPRPKPRPPPRYVTPERPPSQLDRGTRSLFLASGVTRHAVERGGRGHDFDGAGQEGRLPNSVLSRQSREFS